MIGSIAGVTIVLFVLFLPGLAFRRTYFTGSFSKQYAKTRLDALLVAAFVPALMLQLLGYSMSEGFSTEWFYEAIGGKLFPHSATSDIEAGRSIDKPAINRSSLSLWTLALQQVVLIAIGAITGVITRSIVRSRGYDRRFKILRFENVWQYILRGEVYEFPEVPSRPIDLRALDSSASELVYLDVLVEGDSELMIYKGELFDYHLDGFGGIKYLIMSNVSRRKMSKDPKLLGRAAYEAPSTQSKRFYTIPGDMLVIYGEKIANLNVRYSRFVLKGEGDRIDDLMADFEPLPVIAD